jgi:iron complex outermembrane receptor protein
MRPYRHWTLLCSVAPAALIFVAGTLPGAAQAQQSAAGPNQLEEVTVTAEKRTEDVQQVPIAVTAFTSAALQDKGITDIHTLSNLAPNVNFDSSSPFSGSSSILSASIRGIGQDDFAFNLDPGVGVYVDGVYYARTVGANQNLMDVDRVEILKGPQGTLFGRNTIGGAISIVTRTPGDDYMVEGEATTGSYDRRDFAMTADIPITESLLSSITVSSLERDGYQKRVPYTQATPYATEPTASFDQAGVESEGNTQGGQNQQTIRAKFLYKASTDLKFTLTADWTHEDQTVTPNTILQTEQNNPASLASLYNVCVSLPNAAAAKAAGLAAICGPIGPSTKPAPGGGFVTNGLPLYGLLPYNMADASTGNIDTTYATGNNFDRLNSFGGSFTIDYALSDTLAFKSITGYRRLQWDVGLDDDGSPVTLVEPSFEEGQHQLSQELQAIGTAFDSRLNYVGGLYYFNEGGFIHDFVPLTMLQINGPNELDTTSYAAFGHANYKLTDQIGITLGARYSIENKDFMGGQQDLNAFAYKSSGCYPVTTICQELLGFPVPGQPLRYFPAGQLTENYYIFTPTAGAEYHFTDELMSYFSYSKGFKSGGWTTRLSNPIPSGLLAEFGPEKAETYEVGLKSEWFDNRLVANLAAFYTEYDGIQLNVEEGVSPTYKNAGNADILGTELETHALLGDGLSLNGAFGYLDAYYTSTLIGTESPTTALPLGTKLPKTPKFKVSLSPEYDIPIATDSVLRFLGTWTHTTSMFNDSLNTPLLRRPTTDVFDASVQYDAPDDRYEVIVGGTNITNDRYITTGQAQIAGGFIDGTYNAPAEWYLTLRVRFHPEKAAPVYAPPPVPAPAAPPPPPAAPEAKRSFQVFFDFDKSEITAAAAKVIQAAADAVKAGQIVQVMVTGHTDTVGTAAYNQGLSERRAAAVKTVLVADGVSDGEISTLGVGKTGLLVPTADGVREPQNRRAEIVLQ